MKESSDVPLLVHHFMNKMSGEFGKQDIVVREDTMQLLTQYHWPGNIRELRNVIQQSLFNMEGNIADAIRSSFRINGRSERWGG